MGGSGSDRGLVFAIHSRGTHRRGHIYIKYGNIINKRRRARHLAVTQQRQAALQLFPVLLLQAPEGRSRREGGRGREREGGRERRREREREKWDMRERGLEEEEGEWVRERGRERRVEK